MVDITPYMARIQRTKIYETSDNPRGDFIEHLSSLGYTPPKALKDGAIDRIDDPTDKPHKGSGWYIYNQYENIAIASFGTWKDAGVTHTWTSKEMGSMSFAERVKINEQIKINEAKRQEELKEKNDNAAMEAFETFSKLDDATDDNPYLKRKHVKACDGLKVMGDVLYMPILDKGAMTSYQKIMPDGTKRMKTGGRKKGCSFPIKGDDSTVYIAEGLATALSIHEATGNTCYVAIDCGNLYETSQGVKKEYPESHIIIAGENNDTNKAKCEQIDMPAIFPPNSEHDDFNDMHVALGLDAVSEVLKPKTKPKKTKSKKSPVKSIRMGGVLDEIIDYYNATSGNDQPLFAIQSAIATCSVILSRNFVTNNNNFSGLFFLNLAKSGTGKEHGKNVIENILRATDNANLIGSDGYTSASAVISALQYKPRHITIIDEFSKSIEASNNKNGGSHLREANAKIMEAFGRQGGTIRPRFYSMMGVSSKDKQDAAELAIERPALILMAMSTPDDFFNNVGERAIKDGFINRFMVCVSDAQRSVRRTTEKVEVSESIINWSQKIKDRTGNPEDFAICTHEPIQISFTMDALNISKQYAQKCIDMANDLEEFGLEDVPMRSNEISMRLALIIALSEDPNTDRIETHHMEKAIEWVDINLQKTVSTLKMSISGSEFESDKKIILKALRNRNITRSDMHKRAPFSRYKSKDLNEILQALLESGLAENKTLETKGRSKIIWTAS